MFQPLKCFRSAFQHSMLYLLKMTKKPPSQYKKPFQNINCIPRAVQKRTFKIDTKVFFFIDLKSHLHLKYLEEGLKKEKAQPIVEKRRAYRQYTGGATNAGTGLTEASSLWPERSAARLLASEASRLSTVDRVSVEVCPCLSDMAAYGFTQVLSPAGL